MAQTQTVRGRATSVYWENGYHNVRYHNTVVVKWNVDRIILNTGGWETVTTKLRMNQASNQYGLGYQVYQKDYDWFVSYNGQVVPFDGDMLTLVRAA